MTEIRIGKNSFRKRNKKTTIASYHDERDRTGAEPVVFLKYGICRCKLKMFDFEHTLHALEHEFVELECRTIVNFIPKVRIGFDNLSLKWHSFTFPHTCDYVRKWVYG